MRQIAESKALSTQSVSPADKNFMASAKRSPSPRSATNPCCVARNHVANADHAAGTLPHVPQHVVLDPIDRRMDECHRTKPLSLQRSARRLIVKASARPWQRHQEHQERHPRTNQAGPLKAQAPCSYAFSDRPPLKAEQPTVTYAARCMCSHATRIRAPTASGIMRRSYGRSPLQPRARLAPHIHWPASVRQDSRYALRNVAPRFH